MLCFAGPHFGVPVLRTVCKDSVTIVLNESLEMTRTAPVYFWWCWHWFAPFLSCFWHRWHLLLAARKGNVKISFTQLSVVWLEWWLKICTSKLRQSLQQVSDTFLPSSSLQEQPSEVLINYNWIYWIDVLFPSSSIFHSTLFLHRVVQYLV